MWLMWMWNRLRREGRTGVDVPALRPARLEPLEPRILFGGGVVEATASTPLSADQGHVVFYDGFDSDFGFNSSLWDLETYGEGSVGWVAGEYFNMSCERHAYRTLSSKSTFEVGQEVSVRMKMEEAEAIVLVGWTNQTPTTGWNYLFAENSVDFQGALSTPLLEVSPPAVIGRVQHGAWHKAVGMAARLLEQLKIRVVRIAVEQPV